MSLGLGVFASVVLVLAVYHAAFRKMLLWTGAIAIALAALAAAAYFGYDRLSAWKASRAAQQQGVRWENDVRACMARLGTPISTTGSPRDSSFAPYSASGGRESAQYYENLGTCQSDPAAQQIDLSAGLSPTDTPPCPDNVPIGFTLDGYCVLSKRVVKNFRPEMCVGTIAPNGDCQVSGEKPSWAAPNSPLVQICPYGSGIKADGNCPTWNIFDQVAAEDKLREFRKVKPR
jgi:hypothetical protein